jgi:hypothetical protein
VAKRDKRIEATRCNPRQVTAEELDVVLWGSVVDPAGVTIACICTLTCPIPLLSTPTSLISSATWS